jgi:glycerol-3-phosphate dehydrogenase
VRVTVIDEAFDFPAGASRANSGILHAGYDAEPGSLKARLNVAGINLYPGICAELNVAWRRTGSLVVAFGPAEERALAALLARGAANGVPDLTIISGDATRQREPHLAPGVTAALFAPSAGIIDPQGLNIAALENAASNGVVVRRGIRAEGFARDSAGRLTAVLTSAGPLPCRFAVNAAGLGSGRLAAAAGDDLPVTARRGQYLLLDKAAADVVHEPIFPVPSTAGKGMLLIPTAHGNVLAGPTAEDTDDPRPQRTTAAGLDLVLTAARRIVPDFPRDQVIAAFSGVRAVSGADFVIRPSAATHGVLHLAGICSPGLSAAPAVALLARDELAALGLVLRPRADFDPYRPVPRQLLDLDEPARERLLAEDPAYGHIVCRCEQISEGEIVAAIRRPVGARTVDGVKLRTRAGMGRCQGGFCAGRAAAILARELGLPLAEITHHGPGSWLVLPREAVGRGMPTTDVPERSAGDGHRRG